MIQALDQWLPAWFRRDKIGPHVLGVRHIMIAVCDHFAPSQGVCQSEAQARVVRWQKEFPKLTAEFQDAEGGPPKHTFFYPIEQYDPDLVGGIAEVCQTTGSEMEIQLHHENDTAENLRQTLKQGAERLTSHGMLARDEGGALRYGFVHGHGALDNSHPQGHHCGVCNELSVLRETGCYADFTLPSVPAETQTRIINSLYYARATDQPKSHDHGRHVLADRDPQPVDDDELLLVQGPLGLDWKRKQYGVLPRIENGELTAANPPTIDRMRLWMDCRVTVKGRPNWYFMKLHTRGAEPGNAGMLLGEPMRAFHRALMKLAERDATMRFHYVTAREMVNILHAAESGHSGDPRQFRDYRYRRAAAVPASAENFQKIDV